MNHTEDENLINSVGEVKMLNVRSVDGLSARVDVQKVIKWLWRVGRTTARRSREVSDCGVFSSCSRAEAVPPSVDQLRTELDALQLAEVSPVLEPVCPTESNVSWTEQILSLIRPWRSNLPKMSDLQEKWNLLRNHISDVEFSSDLTDEFCIFRPEMVSAFSV